MSEPHETHNHGPVFNGPSSHNQFAWDIETATQNQQNNGPGHEALAELVTRILNQLPQSGLADDDREAAEAAAREVLTEITGPEAPEPGRLRRAVAALRRVLAPVAMGVTAGTTAGAQAWALAAVQGLTGAM